MLQFYFLSVATLLLGGVSLLLGSARDESRSLPYVLGSRSVRYTVGAVALVAGVLKFFVRAPGDTVVVVGDLLPALVGIGVGLALFLAVWSVRAPVDDQRVKKATQLTRYFRYPIGTLAILTGLAHFFVPATVIL